MQNREPKLNKQATGCKAQLSESSFQKCERMYNVHTDRQDNWSCSVKQVMILKR